MKVISVFRGERVIQFFFGFSCYFFLGFSGKENACYCELCKLSSINVDLIEKPIAWMV